MRTLAVLFALLCITLPAVAALQVEKDLTYHEAGDIRLQGDLYSMPASCARPGVVLIHGGGWTKGNRGQMKSIAKQLAREGFVAFSVGYRLAPEHPFPAALHDVKNAVRWLRANADRYGVRQDQIVTFGYSAGAHLALLAALTGPEDGLEGEEGGFPEISSSVQAAVGGGTPTDLTLFSDNRSTNAFLGGPQSDRPQLYRRASPVQYVSPDDPPVFLYHGRSDAVVGFEHASVLADDLRQAGVPVELYPGRFGHFYRFLFGGRDVAAAAAFLKQRLDPVCEAAPG